MAIFLTAVCLFLATPALADKDTDCPVELATQFTHLLTNPAETKSEPIVFADRLPAIPNSWVDRAIDSSIARLFGRSNFLSTLSYRQFFDANGNFVYHRDRPLVLASETGSQILNAVRLNLNSKPGEEGRLSKAILKDYGQVLRELPDLKIKIVAHVAEVPAIKRWIRQHVHPDDQKRVEIVWNFNLDRYIWAQDGSKSLAIPDTTVVQNRGTYTNRWGYRQATMTLEKAGIEVIKSDLPFEGGNIIVGDYHVFIGSDIIQWLMSALGISRPQALAAYNEQFGMPVIEVGIPQANGFAIQPAFHLDLFMAVVRDHRYSGFKNVVVLQSPALMDPSLLGPYAQSQNIELDQIEKLLRQNNYEVIRIPGYYGNRYEGPHFYSYTNAIFSGQTALVPHYDVRSLDESAYEIYRSLGYRIIPMRSSKQTIRQHGAIRCASETFREACVTY